jgi:hypothetical protein
MRGLISNLFKKSGQFRPQVGQVIELEWTEPGVKEVILYGSIAEVKKKTLSVACTAPLSEKLGPGSKLRVCSLSPPWFFSYVANVHSSSGSRLELSLPGQDLDNLQVPTFTEEEKLNFATSVDYQASRSPYKQAAEVVAVGRKGLTLQTNVSIPSQTNLELFLRMPDRSEPLPAQVKAVRSETLTERKKYATEVEFVNLPEPDRLALWEVALRHHLRVKTRTSPP